MRLPSGLTADICEEFLKGHRFSLIGCNSFEERCRCVPAMFVGSGQCTRTLLFEIADPPDAFPDFSTEIRAKTDESSRRLTELGVKFRIIRGPLLAMEDDLLGYMDYLYPQRGEGILVIDITSLPKRYFCFVIKRLIRDARVRGVVATYTSPADGIYGEGHVAQDPVSCDHLPGFTGPLHEKSDNLVVSLGFELLGLRSLVEMYHYSSRRMRLLLPMPTGVAPISRQWSAVKEFCDNTHRKLDRNNLEIVATWDVEQAFRTMHRWNGHSDGLSLAPFGPKPHSLAMMLFALKYGSGMYYSQPKSYSLNYSFGTGVSWAYVLKWDGIACYDRTVLRS